MLRWIEGFEGLGTSDGSAVSGLSIKYQGSITDANYLLRTGRVSGHAMEPNTNSAQWTTPALATMTTIVVGFAFKRAGGTGTSEVRIFDNAVQHITLQQLTSGEWRVFRGTTLGTQLGTTSGASVSNGTWSYVELKITISDTLGTVDLLVNEVSFLSLTLQDTRNGGNASCDRVQFVGSSTAADDTNWDDIYILDTTGSVNNDFLGSQVVVGLLPAADTSAEDFTRSAGTDSFALVDENPANGDTDYIESSTSANVTRFTYATLSGVANVKGIQINTTCRETDANPFSINNQVKSGATTSDGSNLAIGSTSYVNKSRVVETDPDTAALWTVSGLNAAEIGVKLV